MTQVSVSRSGAIIGLITVSGLGAVTSDLLLIALCNVLDVAADAFSTVHLSEILL